jgi:NADH-quinone oxidoreductase subunit J
MESLLAHIGHYTFHIFGVITIGGAIGMVISKNAIHSVVYFLLAMLAIAGCYLCMSAEFLAVSQLLIYAGGIVVLFLFVVMLVEITKYKENKLFQLQTPYVLVFIIISIIVTIGMLWKTCFGPTIDSTVMLSPVLGHGLDMNTQNAQVVSRGIFSGYMLPFEILSVTLLVALVGAIILAKKDVV